VKGKSITFRPKKELRDRLDLLAKSTERPISYFIEKAIEAELPALEKKHLPGTDSPNSTGADLEDEIISHTEADLAAEEKRSGRRKAGVPKK